eukprot:7638456-Pyramimonas_sp.AAC.1
MPPVLPRVMPAPQEERQRGRRGGKTIGLFPIGQTHQARGGTMVRREGCFLGRSGDWQLRAPSLH